MELYKNKVNTIEFRNPEPNGQVLASATFNGVPVQVAPEHVGGGLYRLSLPWVTTSGVYNVVWTFATQGRGMLTKTESYRVITPLLETQEIRDELELGQETTDAQIVLQERRVRRIIENHCGQVFDETQETLMVRGRGESMLWLPKRLLVPLQVTDTRSGLPWTGFAVEEDGWALRRTTGEYYDTITSVAPIYAPYQYGGVNAKWPSKVAWAITGSWGWSEVPESVREAGLVLLEQRMCNQSAYRDNYLSSMKAADWRFDIAPDAFAGTGNVVSDQLLKDYVTSSAAVI